MKNRLLFSLVLLSALIPTNVQSMGDASSLQGGAAYLSAIASLNPIVDADNDVHILGEQLKPNALSLLQKRDKDYAASVRLRSERNAARAQATDIHKTKPSPDFKKMPQPNEALSNQQDTKDFAEISPSIFPKYSGYLEKLKRELEPDIVPEPTNSPKPATAVATKKVAQTQSSPAKSGNENHSSKPNLSKALSAHALKSCPIRLKQAINAIQRGKNFTSYKRFLLVGPSGTGKSTIAQAIADECGLPLLFHRASFIASTYQNGGDQNLKAIFEEAFTKQPCILVVDELNTLFEKYGRAQDGDQGMLRSLWSMIDESEKHKVIFIGTCNYVKDLPPQIATRFPGIIKIDLPGEEIRKEALSFHMSHHYMANYIKFNAIDVKKIAQKTESFSLREIANLIDLASLVADANNDTKDKLAIVNTEDILELIPEILERRYDATDKTTDEWKEYAKTALQYGFQVATFAGQMAFQKWMQEEQFKHTNGLHADGKAHQTSLAEKQNSTGTIMKNSAISAATGAVVSGLVTTAMSPTTTYCSIQ